LQQMGEEKGRVGLRNLICRVAKQEGLRMADLCTLMGKVIWIKKISKLEKEKGEEAQENGH